MHMGIALAYMQNLNLFDKFLLFYYVRCPWPQFLSSIEGCMRRHIMLLSMRQVYEIHCIVSLT